MALAVPFPAPEQFELSVAEHVTVGLLVLLATLLVHDDVQPVVISVTVTVYTPAFKPLMLDVVAPLLQVYVTLVAVALAVPFGVVQLLLSVEAQVTAGLVVFVPTTDAQLAVHPVVKSVTITVYVPAESPLMLALVEPLLQE